MDSLLQVEQRIKVVDAQCQELEEAMVQALEKNDRERVGEIEEEIQKLLRERSADQTLVDYYHLQGQHLSVTDLYLLHYRSTRKADIDLEELNMLVTRWSDTNVKRKVTGLLIATDKLFFGTLEGPKEAVEEAFEQFKGDSRHTDCKIVAASRAESRRYKFGLKLHVLEDDVVAATMHEMASRVDVSERYAPQRAAETAYRGGDALGLVPQKLDAAIIIALQLDSQSGAFHHAQRYIDASNTAYEIAGSVKDAMVVRNFGESMIVVFPSYATATPAITVAKRLVEEIPYAVVGVHVGDVTLVTSPDVGAFGHGIRETEKLVRLAEHERRPLMITPEAHDRCNQAHHKLEVFSVDTVRYYTATTVGDTRLESAPAPVVVGEYIPKYEPPAHASEENTLVQEAPRTAEALQQRRQEAALVSGAMTHEELQEKFRLLDKGNVGWISKQGFRKWISDNAEFPVFEHDLKKLDGWMERCNALGSNRLSFDEYSVLYLRLHRQ